MEILLALAAARSRDIYLAASCWGWPGASASRRRRWPWATQVLVIVWYLLTNDCDDQDLGGDYFVRRDSDRARQRAVAQLQALGYEVTLQPAA
jgi:transposase